MLKENFFKIFYKFQTPNKKKKEKKMEYLIEIKLDPIFFSLYI